jgi:single-stranded-DNA-specific exonuclease
LSIEGDENYQKFTVAFKAYATQQLAGVELTPRLDVEERLTPSEATLATVESIRKLEPHGVDNPRPLFLLEDVRVIGAMTVGEGGKHLRLTVTDDRGGRLQCIGFRMGDRPWIPAAGDRIDAVVELDVNEWQGMRSPQGKLVDFRPSAPKV